MTTDTGNHSTHGAVHPAATRSRWLIPGIAVGIAATALLIAGVISVTTLLSVGAIGGMLFMHLGHGAHGGHDRTVGSETTESDHDASADRPESHSSRSCH
jgi:hypothetical protein